VPGNKANISGLAAFQRLKEQAATIRELPIAEAKYVPVETLHPMPNQPRRYISEQDQEELVADIKEHGITTPLIVRQLPAQEGGGYEIVAGGRRYEAALTARLAEVPVIIKELSPKQARRLALVDNILRADLDPRDEGAYFLELARDLAEDGISPSLRALEGFTHKKKDYIRKRMLLVTEPDALEQWETGLINLNDLVKRRTPAGVETTTAETEPQQAPDDGSPSAGAGTEAAVAQAGTGRSATTAAAPPRRVAIASPFKKLTTYVGKLEITRIEPEQKSALRQTLPQLIKALTALKEQLDGEDQ